MNARLSHSERLGSLLDSLQLEALLIGSLLAHR